MSQSILPPPSRLTHAPSYLYRNPVYHQVVFATLMIIVGYRTAYLLYWSPRSPQIPDEKKKVITRIYLTGVLQFLFGFFVWNLDNIFCGTLTRWKFNIGWPLAFLLEGEVQQWRL